MTIVGTMHALAVGKFIGDCDFVGGSGENAGFVLRPGTGLRLRLRDMVGVVTRDFGWRHIMFAATPMADFVKIDPGSAFNFTGTSTMEQSKNLTYSKDISLGNSLAANVRFNSLTPSQRDEFLEAMLSIVATSGKEVGRRLFPAEHRYIWFLCFPFSHLVSVEAPCRCIRHICQHHPPPEPDGGWLFSRLGRH